MGVANLEFKVFKASKEKTLEDTVTNALIQIEEKQYETSLIANGFAFQGKTCLIGE